MMVICMKESVLSYCAYGTTYTMKHCALRHKLISYEIIMISAHTPTNNDFPDHCKHFAHVWTWITGIINTLTERLLDDLELGIAQCIS